MNRAEITSWPRDAASWTANGEREKSAPGRRNVYPSLNRASELVFTENLSGAFITAHLLASAINPRLRAG